MISTTQEKLEILESAWKKGGWGGRQNVCSLTYLILVLCWELILSPKLILGYENIFAEEESLVGSEN